MPEDQVEKVVKVKSENFLEMDGSEQLIPGQNFYDQQPFNEIHTSVSNELNISIDKLRFISTQCSRIMYAANSNASKEDTLEWNLYQKYRRSQKLSDTFKSMLYTLKKRYRLKSTESENYRDAIIKTATLMGKYPYLDEYLIQRDKKYYNNDGTFKEGRYGGKFYLPESYAFWVSKKISTAKNQVSAGIEEVFPQDFGKSETTLPGKSKKRETRRWKILKASEFIPEKR